MRTKTFFNVFLYSLLLFWPLTGCQPQDNRNLILATTTSVQDTGLLELLIESYQRKTGISIKTIAVGTGQALEMGRTGEADVLLVHSPDDEKRFVAEGFGTERITFMHNDFVIVGPRENSAHVEKTDPVVTAFKKIAATQVPFVSRGDDSGTHKKEKRIWVEAKTFPEKKEYIEVGQGMSATLFIADEKEAYCLTDRATYLSLQKTLDVVLVNEGDPGLMNTYSLIPVNADKFPKINAVGAKKFLEHMLSVDTQKLVKSFGRDRFGQALFIWDEQL